MDNEINRIEPPKPLTKEDIIARAIQAEEDIKNGNFISLEEFEKEMESW